MSICFILCLEPAVIVERPLICEIIGDHADGVLLRHATPAQAIATRDGAPYVEQP